MNCEEIGTCGSVKRRFCEDETFYIGRDGLFMKIFLCIETFIFEMLKNVEIA